MPIGLVFLAASLISGAVSAQGKYQSSKDRERAMKANAEIARLQGIQEEKAFRYRAEMLTETGRDEAAAFFNEMSNRGIRMEGSPLLLATKQYSEQLEDRNELYRQGAIARIRGGNQSGILTSQAEDIANARGLQLTGDIIQTGVSAAGSYYSAGGSFLNKTPTTSPLYNPSAGNLYGTPIT